MSTESAYTGSRPHRPLTWLAGLLLLVAAVLGGHVPGTAATADAEPAHHAVPATSDTLAAAEFRIPSSPDAVPEAIEPVSEGEGDDAPTQRAATACLATAAAAPAACTTTAASVVRRWRHRGQAPPLA